MSESGRIRYTVVVYNAESSLDSLLAQVGRDEAQWWNFTWPSGLLDLVKAQLSRPHFGSKMWPPRSILISPDRSGNEPHTNRVQIVMRPIIAFFQTFDEKFLWVMLIPAGVRYN